MADMSLDEAVKLMVLNHKLYNTFGANHVADAILKADPSHVIAKFYKDLTREEKFSDRFFQTHIAGKINPKPQPILFDVGGNEGQSIDKYLQMVPNGRIHSFEAVPDLALTLKRKYAGRPMVVINDVALGSQPGTAEFFIHKGADNNGIGSFIPLNPEDGTVKHIQASTEGSVQVPVDTIDGYCERAGVEFIDFVKLDVQGFEPEVLAGAERMLRERRIHFIQTEIIFTKFYERPGSFHAIERLLAPHGYTLLALCDLYPGPCTPIYSVDAFYSRDPR